MQWHEALEEASRLYFGEQDVEGMLHTLMPLHTKLNTVMHQSPPTETKSEKAFKMVRIHRISHMPGR
jgi:serine/threonine-protein kinase mTOR